MMAETTKSKERFLQAVREQIEDESPWLYFSQDLQTRPGELNPEPVCDCGATHAKDSVHAHWCKTQEEGVQ